MKKIKNKKYLLIAIIVFSLVGMTLVSQAGTDKNGMGWLWGGSNSNFGWVSMNNINPGAGGTISYGVGVPEGNGALNGYAWSSNIGWISFDNSSGYLTGCPSGTCSARRVGNALQGWARIVGIKNELGKGNSGGWEGWISLSGTAQNGSPYGVNITLDPATNREKFGGSAWSNELGWIDFSLAYMDVSIPSCACVPVESLVCEGVVYDDSCGNDDVCEGTRDCSCVPDPNCAADKICQGENCVTCGNTINGEKVCPDLNWKEVRP